jgi:hypothetical protein
MDKNFIIRDLADVPENEQGEALARLEGYIKALEDAENIARPGMTGDKAIDRWEKAHKIRDMK